MADIKAIVGRIAAPIHEKNLQEQIEADIRSLIPVLVENPKRTAHTIRKSEPDLYDLIKGWKIRDLRTRITDTRERLGFTRKSRPAVVYYQTYLEALEDFNTTMHENVVEPWTADEFKARGFQVLAPEAEPEAPKLSEICAIVREYAEANNLEHITFFEDGTVEEQPKPVRPEPRVRKFS